MINVKAGALQAFDDAQPHRPVGIDQHVHSGQLDQERSVPDPGDADLFWTDFREERHRPISGALRKKRRNQNLGEKISLMPVQARLQAHFLVSPSPDEVQDSMREYASKQKLKIENFTIEKYLSDDSIILEMPIQ